MSPCSAPHRCMPVKTTPWLCVQGYSAQSAHQQTSCSATATLFEMIASDQSCSHLCGVLRLAQVADEAKAVGEAASLRRRTGHCEVVFHAPAQLWIAHPLMTEVVMLLSCRAEQAPTSERVQLLATFSRNAYKGWTQLTHIRSPGRRLKRLHVIYSFETTQ